MHDLWNDCIFIVSPDVFCSCLGSVLRGLVDHANWLLSVQWKGFSNTLVVHGFDNVLVASSFKLLLLTVRICVCIVFCVRKVPLFMSSLMLLSTAAIVFHANNASFKVFFCSCLVHAMCLSFMCSYACSIKQQMAASVLTFKFYPMHALHALT